MSIFAGKLIRAGNNAKTIKGDKAGEFATAIMYLAPAAQSLMGNVCPMAVMAGCDPSLSKACLYDSGRAGTFSSINKARIAKTQSYFANRAAFMATLVSDIERFIRWCARLGVKPAVRLNGTSDIQFEIAHPCYRNGARFNSIFEAFPDVRFYDYTKIYKRAYRAQPSNYHLTLSYSAANQGYAAAIVKAANDTGANVAVVFRTETLRNSFIHSLCYAGIVGLERKVTNGDETDMRFLDPDGVIVGLYAKGSGAKKDSSGFVVG